jgi:GTP-binding protein YchF
MSLSVGIVGLPNVGKSTLFNALLQKQQALAANYPFATIEPNVGIVPVPDDKLPILAKVVNTSKITPATVEFVDIAGLVAGASKGEGLGNKFLSHIRETNCIVHVVRAFSDPNVIREGSTNPKSDLEIIQTELQLADLGTLQKQQPPKGTATPEMRLRWETITKWKAILNNGQLLAPVLESETDHLLAKELSLMTAKAYLVACNIDEADLGKVDGLRAQFAEQLGVQASQIVIVCAKLEADLSELEPADRAAYLQDLGLGLTGLEQLIQQAYQTLGLQSFYTAGEIEARAWTITQGTLAPQAAAVIHSDFEQHFIKAHVAAFADFVALGGWKAARDLGKVRQEGKTYIMQKDDVVEFSIGK